MKYHSICIAPEDAQFLETRKYQVNEICRIFRVPPHLVGDLERATFSNIEHQSIEFVQHTIRPWLVRWEQAIAKCLLSEEERTLYFARFNVDGFLRGDYKSRMEGYAIGRQNGWLSTNDIRRLEELPLVPNELGGDDYLVNGNMMPIRKIKEEDKDEN
jgi:phage portal protein, HK97 family|nr:MAG TPA: Portal [Caudoviricetes sp.]